MALNFDSKELEISCPQCGHKFIERIGRLKGDPSIPCPGCGCIDQVRSQGPPGWH